MAYLGSLGVAALVRAQLAVELEEALAHAVSVDVGLGERVDTQHLARLDLHLQPPHPWKGIHVNTHGCGLKSQIR